MEVLDRRRVNVRAIIFKDGELLANKFKTAEGESEYWGVPGGGLDPYEDISTGLEREIMEETGIAAKVGRLLFVQQFRSKRQHRDEELEFFFHVTNPEDFITIDLATTTHGSEELARCEFITPSTEFLLPAFLQEIDIADYIKNPRPVFLSYQLSRK